MMMFSHGFLQDRFRSFAALVRDRGCGKIVLSLMLVFLVKEE